MKRILIADDEVFIAYGLKSMLLSNMHYEIDIVSSGKAALFSVKKNKPDLVFMDISMESRESGIIACSKIKKIDPSIKIVFLSGYPSIMYEKELNSISYEGYLEKPVTEKIIIDFMMKI
jgi:YesN/AraC family two-component response regulator